MSVEVAMRLSEALLALALIQQSLEHLQATPAERPLFLLRIAAAAFLLLGFWPGPLLALLVVLGVVLLHRFDGPYNGGSDRLSFLALLCLTTAQLVPAYRELALGYLALQVTLSYLVSGWVKLRNPDWRSGAALGLVFTHSVYPVSESLRSLGTHPALMRLGAWGVIGFELAMPLGFLHPVALAAVLSIAAAFHLANACLFGLNRFFWVWISTYPVLFWLQARLLA